MQISESHEKRLVKVFAQTEYGVDLPMCSFVRPMRAGRLLDSPRHVARFVSLLGMERDSLDSIASGRCAISSNSFDL